MRTIYRTIHIPVDQIKPIPDDVQFIAPEFGISTATGPNTDAIYLERKMQEFFVSHFTSEFLRLWSPDWVTEELRVETTPSMMGDGTGVQPVE